MTAAEYEDYVSEVVRALNLGPTASLVRNAKLKGIRQPGEYEIDIAVTLRLAHVIDFLLILECKNWSRPVDRPAVQKLAQTKDAVGAHKAALVSPIGFSKEAREVAEAHGIALWVLSKASWTVIMAATAPPSERWAPYLERARFLQLIGFPIDDSKNCCDKKTYQSPGMLVSVEVLENLYPPFSHPCWRGNGVIAGSNEPGFDPRLAVSQIADACAALLGIEAPVFEPPPLSARHEADRLRSTEKSVRSVKHDS